MSSPGLTDGRRVLLDTSAFVYFLEAHPKYFQLAGELMTRLEQGRITGMASVLVLAELLVPCYRTGDSQRAAAFSDVILSGPNLEIVPVTVEVSDLAARLRAQFGINTPDAVHAATAILGKADTFVTNDLRLKRLAATGIEVWLFDEHL